MLFRSFLILASQVTYGSGNVAGVIAKDDISISTLKLAGLTFGVTTLVSSPYFRAAELTLRCI